MALVIYDMDDTLIDADCSQLWVEHLADIGLANREDILQEASKLNALYAEGSLNMTDYLAMFLGPHIGQTVQEATATLDAFIDRYIVPCIRPKALENIRFHKQRGDHCIVVSASAEFLIQPIALRLGIDDAVGVEIELTDNRITGNPQGVICYQDGKITRLKEWLARTSLTLENSWFYSDSHNDLPLLNEVDNPVAVSPDSQLLKAAEQRGWLIEDWRIPGSPNQ